MANWTCRNCGFITDSFAETCPGCSEFRSLWQQSVAAAAAGAPSRIRGKPVSLAEVWGRDSKVLLMRGEWNKVFGRLAWQFALLVYGQPGGGKTTWLLRFADELARSGRVLFVSAEMGTGNQLAEYTKRLEIRAENVMIGTALTDRELDEDIQEIKPRFLIIDSISISQFSLDYLAGISERLKMGVGMTCHQTKAGQFAGPSGWAHWVDIVARVEGMRFGLEKNRFGVLTQGSVLGREDEDADDQSAAVPGSLPALPDQGGLPAAS